MEEGGGEGREREMAVEVTEARQLGLAKTRSPWEVTMKGSSFSLEVINSLGRF